MTRSELRSSAPALRPGAAQAWTSRPWISTAEFAAEHFRLVTGPDKGLCFQHEKSPYARFIMDLWDQPWVRKVFVVAPSQTTKTTIAYACLAAELYRDPSPGGVGMRSEETLRRVFKEKLHKHYSASPVLAADLAEKDALQVTHIQLKGATVYGMWSGSEASMSSTTMRVVVIDEEDAYDEQGAARTQEERVISYPDDSKVMRVSKPRGTMMESSIWRDMQRQAQAIYQWEVSCPACGGAQIMDKDNIVVLGQERDPSVIRGRRLGRYRCEHCGELWTDAQRNKAVAAGRGVTTSTVARPEIIGVHLPSWLSPQISLSAVLADWFEAHQSGIPDEMVKWDNNHKAMPGRVIALETDADRIRQMVTDRPPLEVPAEAWCLTAGIDVQMTGFYFVVRAWSRTGESWLVQHGFLDSWSDVDTLLESRWPVEARDDVVMPLWRAAIDIGGYEEGQDKQAKEAGWSQTEETKNWLYEHGDDIVSGVKGASRRQDVVVKASQVGKDPDVPKRYQNTLTIRILDTSTLKAQVQARMWRGAEMGTMWLHSETGEDYIRQICAERQVVGKDGRITWQAHGANHYLDCEVYAAACAHVDWAPNMRQSIHQPDYRPTKPVRKQHQPQRGPLSGMRINPNFSA